MRVSIAFALLASSAVVVEALGEPPVYDAMMLPRHRLIRKRCKGSKHVKTSYRQRQTTTTEPDAAPATSQAEAAAADPTTVVRANLNVKPAKTTTEAPAEITTTTTSAKAEQTTATSAPSTGGKTLIGYSDSKCGKSGATAETTNGGGPNGAQSWLNCGLSPDSPDSPWTPPHLTFDMIDIKDLSEAVAMDNSAFSACGPYLDSFNKIGNEVGIPPIVLASIAMQESTCNPSVTGGGGEQGMFQITSDKCGGAPGGNCKDVEFNMRTGAKYLASTLSDNNGDLLLSIGMYNGWYSGLTYNKATAARYTSCPTCQNNLDYLTQMLNGWFLGLPGYSLGTIKNLQS